MHINPKATTKVHHDGGISKPVPTRVNHKEDIELAEFEHDIIQMVITYEALEEAKDMRYLDDDKRQKMIAGIRVDKTNPDIHVQVILACDPADFDDKVLACPECGVLDRPEALKCRSCD